MSDVFQNIVVAIKQLDNKVDDININLVKQGMMLDSHMSRTKQLEERFQPIEASVVRWGLAGKLIVAAGVLLTGVAGVAGTILALISYWK
jgi:hypothetical protein